MSSRKCLFSALILLLGTAIASADLTVTILDNGALLESNKVLNYLKRPDDSINIIENGNTWLAEWSEKKGIPEIKLTPYQTSNLLLLGQALTVPAQTTVTATIVPEESGKMRVQIQSTGGQSKLPRFHPLYEQQQQSIKQFAGIITPEILERLRLPKPVVTIDPEPEPSPTATPNKTSSNNHGQKPDPSPTATPNSAASATPASTPNPNASPSPSPAASPAPSPTVSPSPTPAGTPTATPSPEPHEALKPYSIINGDLISVRFKNTIQEAKVDWKGNVKILPMGNIKVFGLTKAELTNKVRTAFAEMEGLDTPIEIMICSGNYNTVTVTGSVISPNLLKLPKNNKATLEDAITSTGGFALDANQDQITIKGTGSISFVTYSEAKKRALEPGDEILINSANPTIKKIRPAQKDIWTPIRLQP